MVLYTKQSTPDNNESTPLIRGEQDNEDPPGTSNMAYANNTSVILVKVEEFTPPVMLYSSSDGSSLTVQCVVCERVNDITDRDEQHVIKCVNCNEATPIRLPPHGRQYIRCTCNCLLICKTGSRRVACPRATCRSVLTVQGARSDPEMVVQMPVMPGVSRFKCPHCEHIYLADSDANSQTTRCPECLDTFSVGYFARRRGLVLALLSFIVFLTGVITTTCAWYKTEDHKSLVIVFLALFAVSFACLARAIYYFRLRVIWVDTRM